MPQRDLKFNLILRSNFDNAYPVLNLRHDVELEYRVVGLLDSEG